MFERWLERLRPRVDGERALAAVREIAKHHRIQSTPGYDAAADWLTGALRAEGLAVEVERPPADGRTRFLGCPLPEGWDCERATATLQGARGPEPLADFSRRPLSLVQRSESGHGRFPLVAAGEGVRPSDYEGLDVRGRVVLVHGAVQRAHALAVVERGAAGLICDGRRLQPPVRTDEHDRESLAYTSFWWLADEPRGWGFVVSPARGAELRARLAANEALAVEAEVVARRFATTAPLVSATLRGTLAGEVLVLAHLCHPRPGANDNASGVAAALEAARALAGLARERALGEPMRTIRFLWMPEFTGTYAWLAGDPGRAARTVAALNLDMVGESQAACGSTQLLERSPHFAAAFTDELVARIRHASQDWVPGFSGAGHYSLTRMAEVPYSGGSDHTVWSDPAVGVPCPLLIQWPDRYYHSDLDTPERCDPASLGHAARVAAVYAATLACADADDVRRLITSAARAARRRLLSALDAPEPGVAVEAELLRGQMALASVARLACPPAPGEAPAAFAGGVASALERGLPLAAEELEGFFESEIRSALPAVKPAGRDRDPRVPLRIQRSPLVPMRSLQPGLDGADEPLRQAWIAVDEWMPGGSTGVDLAWFACDGRRTVGEIAGLLRAEGCAAGEAAVARLFEVTSALGASAWADQDG
ncbi:MAG: DUF4910 domain-containing protein [Candidatus Eisenbacteria bacterium]|nr:DUF4910 domain-containing protein [Candidatus Eisenbacteria bacterium]